MTPTANIAAHQAWLGILAGFIVFSIVLVSSMFVPPFVALALNSARPSVFGNWGNWLNDLLFVWPQIVLLANIPGPFAPASGHLILSPLFIIFWGLVAYGFGAITRSRKLWQKCLLAFPAVLAAAVGLIVLTRLAGQRIVFDGP